MKRKRVGRRFAVVDFAGQLHVFAAATSDATLRATPRDQYLVTDYSELIWDDRGYAIDAATRGAPHLAHQSRVVESSLSLSLVNLSTGKTRESERTRGISLSRSLSLS